MNGWMENEWMDGWKKEWLNEEGEKERKLILTFLMPALYFSHKDLNEVELKIKCLLTKKGARHPQHLNILLYASRLIGGRGLREMTNIYKIKIKSALRITTSKYPKLQAVAQFQQAEEVKDRRSMLKDTKKCAVDMKMILELANDPRLSFETTERRIYIALRPKHCEKAAGQKALG